MVSIPRSFSDPSTACRMRSGRLETPRFSLVLKSMSKPNFGRDHHLVADRTQSFANDLFVGERPVDLRGVEESSASFNRGADQRDALFLAELCGVAESDAHAAEPDGRDFQTALTELSLLHCCSPSWIIRRGAEL